MSESKHALFSPSGSHKWLVCVGSVAMEQGYSNAAGEHADEGTAAHTLAAMCLTEGRDAHAYLGRYIPVGFRTFEVDDDFADAVQVYVDAVRAKVEEYKLRGAISVTLEVEQAVPIGHITGEEGAEGTADAVIIAEWEDHTATIYVGDLKFGRGVEVECEENSQLKLYGLGALEKFGLFYEFTDVHMAIHQPRLRREPSEWECTIQHLHKFSEHASHQAYRGMQVLKHEKPEAYVHHLTAGDHCAKSFCKARADCPKLAMLVTDTVGADFDALISDPDATKERWFHHPESDSYAQMTMAQAESCSEQANLVPVDEKNVPEEARAEQKHELAKKLAAVDAIEDWCRAVRARAESVLLQGGEIPGFKLVQGRQGNRAWSNPEEAEQALKSMRLRHEEMYSYKLISPTKAEKVLKDSPKRWNRLQQLITRSEGKPTVVPSSDKRPALVIAPVADDFEEIAEAEGLV